MGRKTIASTSFKYRGFPRPRGLASWLMVIVLFAGAAWLIAQLDRAGTDLAGTARAADGDTLIVSGDRIRMLGIDAPELAQMCWHKDGSEWACGKVAHERLASLVKGKTLSCNGSERDKYDRLLATCSVDERDLGAILVREGLATADWEYKADEVQARSKGVGIWGGRFETPRQWRDAHGARNNETTIFSWLGNWL